MSIHRVNAHHLTITSKTHAPNLASLIKGILDHTARPDHVIRDPWSDADLARLRSSGALVNEGAFAESLAELDDLSPDRKSHPAVVLQRVRLLDHLGDIEALRNKAISVLQGAAQHPPAVVLTLIEALSRLGQLDLADRLDAEHLGTIEQPSMGLLFQRMIRALNRRQASTVANIISRAEASTGAKNEATLIRLMAERRSGMAPPEAWQAALMDVLSGPDAAAPHFLATMRSILMKEDAATAEALMRLAQRLFPGDPVNADLIGLWKGRTA